MGVDCEVPLQLPGPRGVFPNDDVVELALRQKNVDGGVSVGLTFVSPPSMISSLANVGMIVGAR